MNHFEAIQSEAMGTHGVFTYRTAHAMGILSPELSRWKTLGRIVKVGHGVYRLTAYPLQGTVTDMASILAEVGIDSYLYGETVLGFLELCPTRSYKAFIATPHRCRRTLSEGIRIVRGERDYRPMYEKGIPCQRVDDAILSSIGSVDSSRLLDATDEAVARGYLTETEARLIQERIAHGCAAQK